MYELERETVEIGRRAFLKQGTLLLSAAATSTAPLVANDEASVLRVGLVTDLHYADKPPAGSRHYRETPDKLAAAVEQFGQTDLDFVVELGDFIDAADSVQAEREYLKRINRDFAAIHKQRHYVLGNHCVYTLTKEEFLDGVEQEKSYYSFDSGAYHFIVLDSCFRHDGKPYGRKNFEWTDPNVPEAELEWLRADLQATNKPTIVFAHQRLDVGSPYGVKNAPAVRELFESGDVRVVLQGHSHKNDHNEINGIHYCTLVAMIEGSGAMNNGFSTMELHPDGTIAITGFVKQASYQWSGIA